MAKELGIGSVVTGTVREEGARVRVNVELIDAQSGQVIWSDQYDREGVDVFAAQSDIALQRRRGAQCERDARRAGAHRQAADIVSGGIRTVRSRANCRQGKTNEERLQGRDRSAAAVPWRSTRNSRKPTVRSPATITFWARTATCTALPAASRPRTGRSRSIRELASGYRGLALNLHQMGRLREALPAYRKAVALDPSHTARFQDGVSAR